MKRRITISITHHQMRILLLRATSLILRIIHLAAKITLIIINEVLKRKLIELVLIRIIDALIKSVLIIIKRSNDLYLNELKLFEVLIQ